MYNGSRMSNLSTLPTNSRDLSARLLRNGRWFTKSFLFPTIKGRRDYVYKGAEIDAANLGVTLRCKYIWLPCQQVELEARKKEQFETARSAAQEAAYEKRQEEDRLACGHDRYGN